MNDKALRNKIKKKIPKGERETFMLRLGRKVTFPLLKSLLKTSIKPNHITYFSYFLLFLSGIFIATGKYIYLLASILTIWLVAFLDALDGDLARAKGIVSSYGAWIDSLAAIIMDFILVFAVIIGLYIQSSNNEAFLLWHIPLGINYVLIIAGLTLTPLFLFKISGSEFHRRLERNKSRNEISPNLKQSRLRNMFSIIYRHDTIIYFLSIVLILNQLVIFLIYYLIIYWTLLIGQHIIQIKILNKQGTIE